MRKTVTIADLGTIVTGNTPPRKNPELYGDYTPFIKATDISENEKHTYNPEECYSELGHKKYKSSLIPKDSTLVVTIGSVGKKMTMAHCACFINQAMNAIIPNEKFDAQYIYYAVKNSLYGLKSLDSGTASGRENVSKSAFSKMEINVEDDKSKQIRIGKILSAYDDIIENNQKQIKLLEEAAQRLYKEWFIDLRFPGHETTKIQNDLPEGWIEQTVSDFIFQEIGGGWGEDEVTQKSSLPAFVIRGADIDGINHGDFSNIPFRFHSESNLEQRTLQDGDIVFEVSGGSKTEGVAKTLLITDKLLEQYSSPVICASFCKKISPKEGLSQYFYDALRYMRMSGITSEYDKKSASSIVNYRWKDFLSQQHLVLPSENVLRMYDKIAKPIYKNIQTKSVEIEKLKQARDRLLPKLMSGEIEV